MTLITTPTRWPEPRPSLRAARLPGHEEEDNDDNTAPEQSSLEVAPVGERQLQNQQTPSSRRLACNNTDSTAFLEYQQYYDNLLHHHHHHTNAGNNSSNHTSNNNNSNDEDEYSPVIDTGSLDSTPGFPHAHHCLLQKKRQRKVSPQETEALVTFITPLSPLTQKKKPRVEFLMGQDQDENERVKREYCVAVDEVSYAKGHGTVLENDEFHDREDEYQCENDHGGGEELQQQDEQDEVDEDDEDEKENRPPRCSHPGHRHHHPNQEVYSNNNDHAHSSFMNSPFDTAFDPQEPREAVNLSLTRIVMALARQNARLARDYALLAQEASKIRVCRCQEEKGVKALKEEKDYFGAEESKMSQIETKGEGNATIKVASVDRHLSSPSSPSRARAQGSIQEESKKQHSQGGRGGGEGFDDYENRDFLFPPERVADLLQCSEELTVYRAAETRLMAMAMGLPLDEDGFEQTATATAAVAPVSSEASSTALISPTMNTSTGSLDGGSSSSSSSSSSSGGGSNNSDMTGKTNSNVDTAFYEEAIWTSELVTFLADENASLVEELRNQWTRYEEIKPWADLALAFRAEVFRMG
ncbi:hypothetical protein BGZ83_002111 [Gryganskiella cystojenkinii]|nr:hypothetical protein BGZ83_002111 [Gryganskiella cystojenkinii]